MRKTNKQVLGDFGEELIAKQCSCWNCGRKKTYKKLPKNFKCADLICDFCGALSQVKTKTVGDVGIVPDAILGAAWGPQKERMDENIYFTLYVVLKEEEKYSVWILPSRQQNETLFNARKPLSPEARRAGWQGFSYDLSLFRNVIKRIV